MDYKINTTALINEVVSLPVEDRSLIVESLLQSLNQPETDIDDQWAKLAVKRLEELRSAKVNAIDGQQVFSKICEKLKK